MYERIGVSVISGIGVLDVPPNCHNHESLAPYKNRAHHPESVNISCIKRKLLCYKLFHLYHIYQISLSYFSFRLV